MPDASRASPALAPTEARLAYVALGANLGEAEATVRQAAAELAGLANVQAHRLSPLYRTAPFEAAGPDFINGVIELSTTFDAVGLWRAMQAIEQAHGRERPYRNAPRTLDLDLLWFDGQVLDTAELTVPHPRIAQRAFVLQPLADLAPGLRLGTQVVSELLQRVDKSGLRPA